MEDQIIDASIQAALPVFEGSVVVASYYTKMCGRTTLTATDMEYGMKYAARNFVGPEWLKGEEEEEEEEDDDVETVDDDDGEEWTRYTGDDPLCLKINDSYDTWDDWIPTSPIESMLKNSISKTS